MGYEQKLVGLDLMSVTLARGTSSFQLSGKIDGEYHRYDCSSSFEVCFEQERLFKDDIIDHPSTLKLWNCLERELVGLKLSEDGRVCTLALSGGLSIFLWSLELAHDNLMIAQRWQSDEWFKVG